MTKFYWSTTSDPVASNFAICGNPGARILEEAGESSIEPGGFSCADPVATTPQTFYVAIRTCANPALCTKTKVVEVKFEPEALRRQLCPRKNSCGEGDSCLQNCLGPQAATSPAEGWPGFSLFGSGPGATLRYAAGGVAKLGNPQPASWTARLGRYWSHDYAEAIVQAPGVAHVWLLTRWSTYREFTDSNSDGFYETVSPSDEKRRLDKVTSGWELKGLDGTVDAFDSSGRWTSRSDRFGNSLTGSYDGSGRLSQVDFPDGRREQFGYDGGGRLTSITEVGVDGTTSRSWGYVWSGDLLTRIDRPDSTKIEFTYTKAFPGVMTRMTLRGTDGTSTRVLAAWEYDSDGRVKNSWKGATAFDWGTPVDKWSFSYTDTTPPELVTAVTDPLGVVSTFTFGRDAVSAKPKILQLSGDCPTCGSGPNSSFTYGDSANPLLPTRVVDGRSLKTDWAYDQHGQVVELTEAAETVLARAFTYEYDATYPALLTAVERPSTTGNLADLRRTEYSFDGNGRLTGKTIEGVENAAAFSLTTTYTPTTEGQIGTIDPPGYGTADQVTFTYDPIRGNLLPLTQTEPLVGTTSFDYDVFNRRTSTTDVNGVESETTFDLLDRLLTSTHKGAVMEDDLVTESRYNVFGDLFQREMPLGNVLEFGYDAAGRLISVERKPDDQASSHGERRLYTLNGNGQHTKEERQSWNGSTWVTVSQTAWQYSTRCHVDKIVDGLTGEQSVTDLAYDCNGNISKVWDPNHPSAGQTATPSTSYTYDSLDRMSLQRQPFGGAGGENVDTGYLYDAQDHLQQVTDANGTVTRYVYSDRDLLTSEVSEVSGTTSSSFNEHGQMVGQTDARGVITTRTIDAADRITFVNLPGPGFDTTYTYDDPLVFFSKGRPTKITRAGTAIEYQYDRFGRRISDGEIAYSFDKNGNAVTMTYPGDLVATYTFDFADRPKTLSVTPEGAASQVIVAASAYRPHGPLSSLSLGNGVVETRDFDSREFPKRILAPGVLDWRYTVDAAGNPTAIADALNGANNKTFGYQDYQYSLTTGNGPWGTRSWTYDKIGNRLTETRGATTDTYSYVPNAATGRSPKISQVSLGGGGTQTFMYDAAGNETQAGGIERTFDDAGKLDHLGNSTIPMTADFVYDGRGFLARARGTAPPAAGAGIFCDGFESGNIGGWGGAGSSCFEAPMTVPTFGSEGTLYSTERGYRLSHVLYFGNRPVALVESPRVQVIGEDNETTNSIPITEYRFLTIDHLGAPILATDSAGTSLWSGGFEPFGADFSGAQAAGVFLRFPGQWADPAWNQSGGFTSLYQNVFRWMESTTGRYNQPDPLRGHTRTLYGYADSRSILFRDRLGLKADSETAAVPKPDCQNCEGKEEEIHRRLSTICTESQRNADCRNALADEGQTTCWGDRCKNGVKVICIDKKGSCDGCGGPCNIFSDHTKAIFLQALVLKKICGNLGRTLAHELGHMCGIGGDTLHPNNKVRANRIGDACGGPP